MKYFRNWVESFIFQTNQGSTYEWDGEKTKRIKSPHKYHDPKDIGQKEISTKTVFVDQQFSREVGMWGTFSGKKKRLVLAGGKVYLLSWNDIQNKHGLDKIISDSSYTTKPEIGKCPLELFNPDETEWHWKKSGMEVFAGSHPGNIISKIGSE